MIFQGSDAKYYDMSKEELMASIKAFDKAHNWCDACFCGFGMVSIIALFAWGVAVLDTNDREKRAPYRLREDQIAFDSAALKMDNYERTYCPRLAGLCGLAALGYAIASCGYIWESTTAELIFEKRFGHKEYMKLRHNRSENSRN